MLLRFTNAFDSAELVFISAEAVQAVREHEERDTDDGFNTYTAIYLAGGVICGVAEEPGEVARRVNESLNRFE